MVLGYTLFSLVENCDYETLCRDFQFPWKETSVIRQLLKEYPGLSLAAFSVTSYLVTTTYQLGYFHYFGAAGDWFNPSLITAVTFSSYGLIATGVIFAVYVAMVRNTSAANRRWWTLYSIYSLVMITYSTAIAFSQLMLTGDLCRMDIVATIFSAVLLLAAPW